MLPIHRSEDQVVLGETSFSFALSVANSWAERIRKSVAEQRSSLADAMVPLVDPLSTKNLTGAIDTSAWCQPLMRRRWSGRCSGERSGDAASFPTVEFKKENLDTIP
ncbi:hypothetical protein Tco_0255099 [Tanacetum coccineum]